MAVVGLSTGGPDWLRCRSLRSSSSDSTCGTRPSSPIPIPSSPRSRTAAPIFWYEPSGQWFVTRHELVHSTLRDRRLGHAYLHRSTDEELGRPPPDPRWAAFHDSERWSLLNLEPPDHTRLRGLVSKVFTPRSVAALRPTIEEEARGRLSAVAEHAEFDLLRDVAQPYSVAVIARMLGVPRADTDRLLGWSHAIVKMYELTTTDDQRARPTTRPASSSATYER